MAPMTIRIFQCSSNRVPQSNVRGSERNSGIYTINISKCLKRYKYTLKHRGNVCLAIGSIGVISLYVYIDICFIFTVRVHRGTNISGVPSRKSVSQTPSRKLQVNTFVAFFADQLIQQNKNFPVCDLIAPHVLYILEPVRPSSHPQNSHQKMTRCLQIPTVPLQCTQHRLSYHNTNEGRQISFT